MPCQVKSDSLSSLAQPWMGAIPEDIKNKTLGVLGKAFQDPWKDIFQCWIADNKVKLREVKTVTMRSALSRDPFEQVFTSALRL